MSQKRRTGVCYGLFIILFKITIVFLASIGTMSVLFQVFSGFVKLDSKSEKLVENTELLDPSATEDRRGRLYEARRNLSWSVCQRFEAEITLRTVTMYDLVPPAPIGLNADILVDRRRKFYWCKVPKAASTSWISMLLSDREFSNLKVSIGKQHMYLRKLMPPVKTIEELREIQTTFFSFMTVRHPFERILSAYRDKFFVLRDTPNEVNKAAKFYKLYGRRIIENYRSENDSSSQDSKFMKVPTFPEFVDFLLSTEVETYNEHWLPYYLLCTPCHLNYTVIAKTEDISDDSRFILDVLNLKPEGSKSEKDTLETVHRTGKQSSSTTSREFYSQLNKEQVKGLYDKYEVDMEMFDYVIEPYLSFALNTLPPKYVPKQDPGNQ